MSIMDCKHSVSLRVEIETFVRTRVRPDHNMSEMAAAQEKQTLQPQQEEEEKQPIRGQGVLPAVITSLLLIPLMLVVCIGVFICWRKNSMYDPQLLNT